MEPREIRAHLQAISHQLNEHRTVQPGVSRSRVPVLGPLIAWVRSGWNQVAHRYYVDPVVDGVNTFNEAAVSALDQIAAILTTLADRIVALERATASLPGQLVATQQEIARAHGQEAKLHGELDALREQVAALQGQLLRSQEQIAALIEHTQQLQERRPTRRSIAEDYWDGQTAADLLQTKEEILTRFAGEDEAAYLERFEAWGKLHAGQVQPYCGPESRVLDIGCGIGRILKHVQAAERWGLDISQGMLDRARLYLEGQAGIHLVKSSGFDFQGVPGDYFDLAYSFLVLQHVDKQAGFNYLRECRRVLKAGGHMLIEVMNLCCDEGYAAFLDTLTREYPLELYTADEARYKLAALGFEVEEIRTVGEGLVIHCRKPARADPQH